MYEEVCYQKPFLKQVIARIDFAAPVTQLEKGAPPKLLNSIVKNFPIVEPQDVKMQEVTFEEGGIIHRENAIRQWNFFSKGRERQLTISPQYIYVQYNTYNDYEEARSQFGAVVEAIAKISNEIKVARFGLRYINQIEINGINPTDWSEFINDDLLAARTLFEEGEGLTRLISVAEIVFGDIGVRFQYGLPNPDYPARIKRPLFVLDFDASVAQAHDLNEALGYMDQGHARIQSLFERSIKEALREKMDVRPIQQ